MNRLVYVILSVVLLIIAIGLGIFLVWPRYQEFSLLRSEIQEREGRLASGQQALTQLRQTQEAVLEHAEDFEKLAQAIPEDPALPALYEHIQQLGIGSGLTLTSISGNTTKETLDGVAVLAFRTDWRGSYTALKNFLDAARRSARILNVGQVTIAANPENPDDMGITFEIFAYASQ